MDISCLKDFQIYEEMSILGLNETELMVQMVLNPTSVKEFHLDIRSLVFIMMGGTPGTLDQKTKCAGILKMRDGCFPYLFASLWNT